MYHKDGRLSPQTEGRTNVENIGKQNIEDSI
jgi:hypothetical protein